MKRVVFTTALLCSLVPVSAAAQIFSPLGTANWDTLLGIQANMLGSYSPPLAIRLAGGHALAIAHFRDDGDWLYLVVPVTPALGLLGGMCVQQPYNLLRNIGEDPGTLAAFDLDGDGGDEILVSYSAVHVPLFMTRTARVEAIRVRPGTVTGRCSRELVSHTALRWAEWWLPDGIALPLVRLISPDGDLFALPLLRDSDVWVYLVVPSAAHSGINGILPYPGPCLEVPYLVPRGEGDGTPRFTAADFNGDGASEVIASFPASGARPGRSEVLSIRALETCRRLR